MFLFVYYIYVLGCFVSFGCVAIGTGYLYILHRSPYRRNLEKVNLRLSWVSGQKEALLSADEGSVEFREFLGLQVVNVAMSWVGVAWYLASVSKVLMTLMNSTEREKNARRRLLNEDLSVQEVMESILDLYDFNETYRDALRKKLHVDLLMTPSGYKLNWKSFAEIKDGLPLEFEDQRVEKYRSKKVY